MELWCLQPWPVENHHNHKRDIWYPPPSCDSYSWLQQCTWRKTIICLLIWAHKFLEEILTIEQGYAVHLIPLNCRADWILSWSLQTSHKNSVVGYCRAPIKTAFTNTITDTDYFHSFWQLSFLLSALKKSVSWLMHQGFVIYLTMSPWRLRGMTLFHLSLCVRTFVNTFFHWFEGVDMLK